MFFAKLGTILCEFDQIRTKDLHSLWKWKLDPYIVEENSCKNGLIGFDLTNKNKLNIQRSALVLKKSAGFFEHQIYHTINGGILWLYVRKSINEVILQYYVNPLWNKVNLLQDNSETAGNLAFEYLGQIFPYCALNYNILTFHGVLLEYHGYGVIISAASGVGKTTRARLWRDHKDALIINGDRATCQKVDGVWRGYGLPWSGTSGEQINRNVPLKALVVLERGDENKVRRMSPIEGFGAVFPHLQCPMWDAAMVGKAMDQIDDFLQNVSILQFSSRPDMDAIETLCEFLEEI